MPEGKHLISRIVSQINNNRLSTSKSPKVDRNLLLSEIANLVEDSSRSNYEIKEELLSSHWGSIVLILDL